MKQINKKILIILMLAISGLIAFEPAPALALTSAQLKKQKAAEAEAARQQAAEKQRQAEQFQSQINTLDSSVNQTENSITKTEGQIGDTQANIKSLQEKIKTEEDNLAVEQKKMHQILASWYMEGESGLLQAVIGSNSLSEVMTKQQYYDSIKQQVETSIKKISDMKTSLSDQKVAAEKKSRELSELKSQQTSYMLALENQKSQKNVLLNMTIQQKAQYLEIAKKAEQEVVRITAEEEARRRSAGNISVSGTGGYPFTSTSAVDPWGFIQRQCTSYAAWYWNARLGKEWLRGEGPSGTGDAKNWATLARNQGYSVSSTPRVGAIISWLDIGTHGHVAIVDKVNSDGSITVSEYNWIPYSYSVRTNVHPESYGSFVYIY